MIQASTFDSLQQVSSSPRRLPKSCPSPSLHLFVLRLTIAFSIILLAATIPIVGYPELEPVVLVAMTLTACGLVHHTGTAFGPRLFPILVWVDIVLTSCEALSLLGMTVFEILFGTIVNKAWGIPGFMQSIAQVAAAASLSLSLLAFSTLKVLAAIKGKGSRSLHQRYDIARISVNPWWKYPVRCIFGTMLWEQSVPGEIRWITILRGLLVLVSMLILIGFGTYQSIVVPLSEGGSAPYREYRVPRDRGLPVDYGDVVWSGVSWKVFIVRRKYIGLLGDATGSPGPPLSSYITVKPRYSIPLQTDEPPECHVENQRDTKYTRLVDWADTKRSDMAIVACSRAKSLYVFQSVFDPPSFDIIVNFTGLAWPGAPGPDSSPSQAMDAVNIFVGMHEDNEIVAYESFMVAKIEQVVPNPSKGVVADLNVATISLSTQDMYSDWQVFQEDSGSSFLAGLSTAGGLGSLLSTLLAMFLGTSLVHMVIRAKPNSPFGYIHNLQSVKMEMAKQCDREYPALKSDLQQLEEKPGVVAYLFNTLIDMEPLGYGTHKTTEVEDPQMNDPTSNGNVPSDHEGADSPHREDQDV